MIAGVVFTTWNGYIQGHYHALYADFDETFNSKLAYYIGKNVTTSSHSFYLGFGLFLLGFYINVDSDARLRSLRKDANDQSYKIPRGTFLQIIWVEH